MPRNASGTYTLPVSSYVSGTVIKSADMNSNLSDIGTALTQSLATNGVSVMTAPLPIAVGSLTSPGLTFSGDTNTGIYQASVDTFTFVTGGIASATIGSDQVFTFAKGITLSSGSVATFTSNTFSFDTTAKTNFWTAIASNFTLSYTIEGGGSVPTTGARGFVEVPCNCTILRVTTMADQSGSAVVDIAKSTYAGFPPSSSICAAAKPTLSTQQNSQDSTLTGWTTSLTAGDILGYNLNSVTTCTRVQVSLLCKRIGS